MKAGPWNYNNWYIASQSEGLRQGEMITRTLLGESLVFVRSSHGSVHAFQNRCPHKGLPLSLGHFQKDQLTCRYHG